MHEFRKLKIWKKAIDFTTIVYDISARFPQHEIFGITAQIRRSAVSISSNIAEGAGRGTRKDFKNYVRISYASSCELESQIIIAQKLQYLSKDSYSRITRELHEIQKMLYTFYHSMDV